MNDIHNAYISLPTRLVFAADISDSLLRAYARLLAASRLPGGETQVLTAPLHIDRDLVPLLGVGYRQAYRRICQLRHAGLVDWTTDGKGSYTFIFNNRDWLNAHHHEKNPPVRRAQVGESQEESGPVVPERSVVVVGDTEEPLNNPIQHQQHAASDRNKDDQHPVSVEQLGVGFDTETGGGEDQNEIYQTTLRWLAHAGVWPDVAERIAGLMRLNQKRSYNQLPGLADILGWMAYCFRYQDENKVENPTALLVSNLLSNRRCPREYLPELYCNECRRSVERCQCEADPEPHYPDVFLDTALESKRNKYTAYLTDRWGVCQRCRQVPCQC